MRGKRARTEVPRLKIEAPELTIRSNPQPTHTVANPTPEQARALDLLRQLEECSNSGLSAFYEQIKAIEPDELRLALFDQMVQRTGSHLALPRTLAAPVIKMRNEILQSISSPNKDYAVANARILSAFGSGRNETEWRQLWPVVSAHAKDKSELHDILFSGLARERIPKDYLHNFENMYDTSITPLSIDAQNILIHIYRGYLDKPQEQMRLFKKSLKDFPTSTYVFSGLARYTSEPLAHVILKFLDDHPEIPYSPKVKIMASLFRSQNSAFKDHLIRKIQPDLMADLKVRALAIREFLASATLREIETLKKLIFENPSEYPKEQLFNRDSDLSHLPNVLADALKRLIASASLEDIHMIKTFIKDFPKNERYSSFPHLSQLSYHIGHRLLQLEGIPPHSFFTGNY
jgi:hypothetical protein